MPTPQNFKSEVYVTEFKSYLTSVARVMDALNVDKELKKQKKIVIKPNLTDALFPPITTDVNCVKAIIEYVQEHTGPNTRVIVAEGAGGCDTEKAFGRLGYKGLENVYGIELIDLNLDDRKLLKNKDAKVLKELEVPKTLIDSYLISVPVPKEHSGAILTCAMKNLIGTYLPKATFDEKIKGLLAKGARTVLPKVTFPVWSKSRLHLLGLDEGIFDLNLYTRINLSIVDAKVGQKVCEIYGEPCDPPLNSIYGGYDSVAIDSYSASLLRLNWKDVKYLRYANGILGQADSVKFKVKEI